MFFNGVNVGPVDINWIDIINLPIFSRVASLALGHRTRASENVVSTLRPRQNGRHFPDDIFKWFCLNENFSVAIKISLNFVPKGPINNIPTLVQIMAWRRPGYKSLSEPMTVSLPTHICVTRPQWAKLTGNRTQWNSTRRVHNYWKSCSMITSSNRNSFRVTGPLWGETTGHRWIPLTKASEAELWCFLSTNGWANNWDAGDLRRHSAHYRSLLRHCNDLKRMPDTSVYFVT